MTFFLQHPLVKSGDSFKEMIFNFGCRVLNNEEIPENFDETSLVQIYKGKGPREILSNSRFIHMKPWLPKLCESVVVGKMKPKIVEEVSEFQIGGLPSYRPSHHLFVVKSVIALYMLMGLAVIIQYFDLRKFFDKEPLRDAMDVLYKCDVPKKAFKLWFKMNERTKISVVTGSGQTESEDIGECLGQGSAGGSIASAANLSDGVDLYFNPAKGGGSGDELSYGAVALRPIIFQDDLARCCLSRNSAQAGNIKLSQMAKSKQLEFHPDKTGFIILGNKQKVEEIRKEISENPIYCGDFITKEKTQERWLGDISHSGGLAQSVLSTIQERSGKVKGAIFETVALKFNPRLSPSKCRGFDFWYLYLAARHSSVFAFKFGNVDRNIH